VNNLILQYLLFAVYASVFFLLIRKMAFFRLEGIPKAWISGAFGIKVLAGIMLYLVYTYYYPDRQNADIYKYFDDGNVLYRVFWESPADFFRIMFSFDNEQAYFHRWYGQMNNWYGIYPTNLYGDGHIMIRFNALARFISLGSLPVHTLFMAFLSFSGLIGLYRLFSEHLANRSQALFLLLFLFPSLLFWSSGVLKEGLILFAGGMLLYHTSKILQRDKILRRILPILISLILLRYSKFYLFALMVPLILAYSWVYLTGGRRALVKYGLMLLATFGIGLMLQFFNPYNNIPEILSTKHNDFIRIAQEQEAGSLFSEQTFDASWSQLIKAMIPGFFNTLIRPLPGEGLTLLSLLSMLENLMIWSMVLLIIFRFRKPSDTNLVLFSLLFFVLIFTLVGIMSPVSGALVRYKVPALPFLVFLFQQLTAPIPSVFSKKS